eukprot:3662527-Amphidinium_carterae.2
MALNEEVNHGPQTSMAGQVARSPCPPERETAPAVVSPMVDPGGSQGPEKAPSTRDPHVGPASWHPADQ